MLFMRTSQQLYTAIAVSLERDYLVLKNLLSSTNDSHTHRALSRLEKSMQNQQKLIRELYETAITDGLTGLKTRAYLESLIAQELRTEPRLGYLIIDIDHFKPYNDTFGHRQGDAAIQHTAAVVKSAAQDGIVARYGGEEFAVFLVRYAQKQGLQQKAENIRSSVTNDIIAPFSPIRCARKIVKHCFPNPQSRPALDLQERTLQFFKESLTQRSYDSRLAQYFGTSKPAEYIRQLQRLTVSIGGAQRHRHEQILELIDRADDALYEAKKQRNCVVIA